MYSIVRIVNLSYNQVHLGIGVYFGQQLYENFVGLLYLLDLFHSFQPVCDQSPSAEILTHQQQELYLIESTYVSQSRLFPRYVLPGPIQEVFLYSIEYIVHIFPCKLLLVLLVNMPFLIFGKQEVIDKVMAFPGVSVMKIQVLINLRQFPGVVARVPVFGVLGAFATEISHYCVALCQTKLILRVIDAGQSGQWIELQVFWGIVLSLNDSGFMDGMWCFGDEKECMHCPGGLRHVIHVEFYLHGAKICQLLYLLQWWQPSADPMIEKAESEAHTHFNITTNDAHRLLFEQKQTISPQQHDCTLISYLGVRTDVIGKVILTDFRCIFKTTKETLYQDEKIKFDFPIGYLARCDSSSETINKVMVFYVEFLLKFGFVLKIKSINSNLLKIGEHVNGLLNEYDSFGEKRAQNWSAQEKCRKWQVLRCQGELAEAADYDNEAWKFLPLYPQTFKVPKPFVGKRNQHDRIVLLSYAHDGKKSVGLWRSGPGKPDPDEVNWVPNAAKKSDHIVVEVKTKIVGSNKSLAEQMVQLDGPIQLRESFMKFFIASCYEKQEQQQQQRWLINANFSRWYEQVDILISEAFLLQEKLCDGVNITVLSDWDARSSQICALVQVLIRPQNRTISGFGDLIEQQFLHFGNYVPSNAKKQRSQDKGIALIQFLECVCQLTKMYPLSFQFNQQMLTYIAIHVYSRKYGNFLYLTKATTELNQQRYIKYGCIWAKIAKTKQQFTNPFYVDFKECDIYELKRNVGMKNYRLWSSFFLRDILMYSNNVWVNEVNSNQRAMMCRHSALKAETEALRHKLSEQQKQIIQKRKRLKELQKMQLD